MKDPPMTAFFSSSTQPDSPPGFRHETIYRACWVLPAAKVASGSPKPMSRDFETRDEAVAFLRSLRNRFGDIILVIEARSTPTPDGVLS
jgi:hypothetical protein